MGFRKRTHRQQTSPPAFIPHAAGQKPVAGSCRSSSLTRSNRVAPPGEYVGNLRLPDPAQRSHRRCQRYTPLGSLWANMTSSTKPEVHNVFNCRQKKTEPRPQLTCTESFVKFGRVVFEICEQTGRQTDRQADKQTSQ